jgi:hypothetical protein
MRRWLKHLFSDAPLEEFVEQRVVAGSRWRFRPGDQPNPFRAPATATVVEVRDGWVKYTIDGGSLEWESPAKTFVRLYEEET